MLVVQGNDAISWAFVYELSQVEEGTKKTSQRTRERRGAMADSGRAKVGSQPTRKRKSGSMLNFLKRTDVGGREGARERELEWERENDQAGEDLLD